MGLGQAALLYLVLLDEVEGLAFVALGIVLHRLDFFVEAQSALFPAALLVAGVTTGALRWRRKPSPTPALGAPLEQVGAQELAQRIGPPRQVTAAVAPESKWRRALRP